MPVEKLSQPSAAHEHLERDPTMADLLAHHGYLTPEPAPDPFRRLVRSVLRQQVSMAAAEAIWERLTDQFDVTPEAMQAADPDALQAVGLSEAKSEYVQAVATAFEEGWSRDAFAGLDDGTVIERMTDVQGIGPWTAKMFLIFGLGREDVFPVEDLGIRRAMDSLFDTGTRHEMRERAEDWQPYRTHASLYLWRHAESGSETDAR
ncbi:MAG: DNA-3-methyladenine glycosylase [Halodesulfurarchaeum sp.]